MSRAVPVGCAYCGLPVPAGWQPAPAEPSFCCYGCRFAAGVTGASPGGGAEARWMFARLGLSIFFTMNVMVFTMALWGTDVYGSAERGPQALPDLFRYLCMFAALPVLWWLGGPLLENAWAALRQGRLQTDLLLVLGVAAAYLYSCVSVLRDDGPVYFEVGCTVLLLVTLSRWLEAAGRVHATRALEALERLLPERVRLLDGGDRVLAQVAVGERLHVRAGERVPCDGLVLRQPARLDERLLTGESEPRVREPGAEVYAGTLNLDGDLFLEVRRGPEAGALSRIVRMIRQAQQSKGRHEMLADRVTAWFLPLVVLVALGAGAYHAVADGLDHGLMTGLAVLLIACPCALGIATPLAVWVATGEAARHHVLFQSGEALEKLAAVGHMCFDKTGTLTSGEARVASWDAADTPGAAEALERGRALASASNHSLSRAVAAFGGLPPVPCGQLSGVRTLPGRGLCGCWSATGETVYLGSERLMAEQGLALSDGLRARLNGALAAGQSLACVGWEGRVRGLFGLCEEARPEARAALLELRALGLGITVLTGDHAARAEVLARELGVEALAGLLPEQKAGRVAGGGWRLAGEEGPATRHPPPATRTAMVGDGINDGPALAASAVGIAMGCGADVARDSAAVSLLNNDLSRLPWAVRLARRTVRVVRQNLFWALAYNVLGVALAATGRLNPVFAALAMAVSSLLVLANSLRLRGPDEPGPTESSPCSTPC